MTYKLTREKNAQILICLLKAHNIKYIIASPGNTNTAFIGSIQNDNFFKIYSSVDERSAAYLACGLAQETGEAVVISCTGATASRNYLPGLTEAYYRKLPVLAVTSTQAVSKIGHHIPQVIDRSVIQNDVARYSVNLPIVKDDEDIWDCEIKVNMAILELFRHGGGPVHINLPTTYTKPYDVEVLPQYRVIKRINKLSEFPRIEGRIAVFVGSHKTWDVESINALERFALAWKAPVFCDHTSGYKGKNKIGFSLYAAQESVDLKFLQPDILVHIGEISGDYPSFALAGKKVWRVSEDGEIRDPFKKLNYVFEISEKEFFDFYSQNEIVEKDYYLECFNKLEDCRAKEVDLPFSNIWVASQLSNRLPEKSVIHFGILNSLRAWNFFELPDSVVANSNVGGFGIDGCLSSLIGASLANNGKKYFGVVGDLAFFYDMNVLGNRHVGNNVRILVINNGTGVEFKNYNHHAALFGDDADHFVAASGHYGNKSKELIKNYVMNLGYEYISASSKEEFYGVFERFVSSKSNSAIVFEIFTDEKDESDALKIMQNLDKNFKGIAKEQIKNIIGHEKIKFAKNMFSKIVKK